MKNTFTLKKNNEIQCVLNKFSFKRIHKSNEYFCKSKSKREFNKIACKISSKSIPKHFIHNKNHFFLWFVFFFKWIYGVYGIHTVKKLLNEINFGPIWIHCYHLRALSFTMLLFYISFKYLNELLSLFK